MKKLGIASLDELSTLTKIDRGSLSRYFNQDRRPSIDAIVPICTALGVTSDELLIVLGAADNPTAGVKTYQFIVGSTEGDFSMVVDAPYVRAVNLAIGGAQGKITLSYSIKSSSSTVTNADVLKSIVALIASINKQIQALQKLILKR